MTAAAAAASYPESPLSPTRHPDNVADVNEDTGLSEDAITPDQDDAQAVLQPAMSAAASHLTSSHTPAIEKAAALERLKGGGLFDDPQGFADADGDEGDGDGDTTPEQASSPKVASPRTNGRAGNIPSIPLNDIPNGESQRNSPPSPWRAQPRVMVAKDVHSNESRGILGTAFGPTRQRQRSRSTGQEALKKLQKAFPSLASPSHLLPSLPTSFLSTFTDGKQQNNRNSAQPSTPRTTYQSQALQVLSQARSRMLPNGIEPKAPPPASRPPMLRRVTSDDSMLYTTLSRASSLGDDDRFIDVREMVNTRLMAIRDSLPDVPNFKMPSLAKLQAASRRSTISLNGIFSNDSSAATRNTTQPDNSTTSKDESPTLDGILEGLTGDIVVMGGYRGSVLRSAEYPHHQLWAPVKVGLNMRKANLEVGLDDEDEETMEERIIPSGMLQHIGPVDISRKFFKKLRSCENARTGKLRVWDYGYDWRLSPSRLSKRLQDFLQNLPSNQPGVPAEQRGALVIAHSLGGLITRHAVNQRPELFAGVLYAGVPQRCVNILGPLRHGDAVLFNDKLLTAQVNFSIRTSFALLPDDGFCFVDKTTGEEYPVDFFDPMNWVKWHLSPCVAPPLPAYNRQQQHSPLTSLLPNSLLRPRGDSKSEKRSSFILGSETASGKESAAANIQNRAAVASQLNGNAAQASTSSTNGTPSPSSPTMEPERLRRNLEYLGRTLASIRQFRTETAHNPSHEAANAYPPLAVIYGKSIPTVYAARVNGRDAIPYADAYDDLLFRPGDGVVLAKESMLPEGYSIVRGGRVSTERGHITMLGDMPAMGRALKALLRGRRKGIGLGETTVEVAV
ncbi:hypothetical protein PT974_10573 [Cladobotryum mycophilum]|uniref:Uncharacterized protein n=1 Tax=Cladobotryum mycophilum TaxID=491253 RepID=A0ABR0SBA8_9HYPO